MTTIEKSILAIALVAGTIGVGLLLFVVFYLIPFFRASLT